MLRLPSFTYHQPRTLRQALRIKRDAGPTAMYVAGGTDLYPNMKRRHQEPQVVVSLANVPGLRRIRGGTKGSVVSVGACVTLTELREHRHVRKKHSAVARAAELISTPILQNMGTVGGNICLDTRCNYYNQSYEWRKSINFCMKKDGEICWVAPSSPRCWAICSSDLAPVAVAMGAEFTLQDIDAERSIPARDFFRDDGIEYLTKRPDEILTEVRLPPANGWDAVYWKLRRREAFDFPVLGVAVWIEWDGAQVADARIVLGAVASYPLEVPEAAQAILGSRLEDDAIATAADAAYKPSKPMDNTDFGLAWRKHMTREYVKGALRELRKRHS